MVEDISGLNEESIKSYNYKNDKGYFLEVDVQYFENLHNLLNNIFFLPERMKIEKFEKLVSNLQDKTDKHIKKC